MNTVQIHGAKNALLPIIASTILSKNTYIISNFALADDIITQLSILKQFNVFWEYDLEKYTIKIDTTKMIIPDKITFDKNTRGTYYYIGSSISYADYTFKIANGCNIDNRVIDFHISLLKLMNKHVIYEGNSLTIVSSTDNNYLISNMHEITFPKPSVGATLNGLLMYSKGNNNLTMYNYAKDPYIFDQIDLLRKMGAKIHCDDDKIIVFGSELYENKLIYHVVIPDPIETLTYLCYGGLMLYAKNIRNIESKYIIGPISIESLGDAYKLLNDIGIHLIHCGNDYYKLIVDDTLKPFSVKTDFFPGLYTDAQPFFCLLAMFINGTSTINETIYNDRLKYTDEFKKCSFDVVNGGNNIIHINGNVNNINKSLEKNHDFISYDLRGGMAVLLLMRMFNIQDDPLNVQYVKRGYIDYENNINLLTNNYNIIFNYDTKKLTNIKIGGTCKYFFVANNIHDMINIIRLCAINDYKYKIIGYGSNVYFSNVYDGLIILNNIKHCSHVSDDENKLKVTIGSGNLLSELVDYATSNNIDLHNLSGIPGSVGGAVYGNAGAYGVEMKDIVVESLMYNMIDDVVITLNNSQHDFKYRSSGIKTGKQKYVILSTTFELNISNLSVDDIIKKNIETIDLRNKKFPTYNTLGSTFKNIFIDGEKIPVAIYLDKLNLKSQIIHNIKICDTHPNVFININNASDNDLDNCIQSIKTSVKNVFDIDIETEIEKIY
jgi:UDP-N-acetylglucosamine 1-carboxyvinyltransferase